MLTGCRIASILIVVMVGITALADGADPVLPKSWPNWMGPNFDGISHETGWSSTWPANGLHVVWSRQIGVGFSSISIADGRLFTMGHVNGKEIVWCLNANTGEEIWNHQYPCRLNDNLHEGGPGATPTVDGEHVYTLGKEGQLYCLDIATGKVIWEVMLQKDLEVGNPDWGFSSSAVISGNQQILEGGRVGAAGGQAQHHRT